MSEHRRRYEDRLDEHCAHCGHTLREHHWNGGLGGRCCQEVDRYEQCTCPKFVVTATKRQGGKDKHSESQAPSEAMYVAEPLNILGKEIYDWADDKGFHEPIDHKIAEQGVRILLIMSELAEAFEDIRKGNVEHFREEIADVAIRLFHFAAYESIDLDAEVERKMAVNRGRPYKHGKKF